MKNEMCIFVSDKKQKIMQTEETIVHKADKIHTHNGLPAEIAKLQNDLLDLVLKKTGVDYDVLIETAKREFVVSNLDVLNQSEVNKFKKILL
jgi:preprotein translocase subunit YajC